jgi:large subunit ribosomal protein L20
MPRTKGGPKTRHRRKRILKLAKGYWGARRKLYGVARETVDRALAYAFSGRKQRKRQFRKTWISRINGGLGDHALSYSKFIFGLKQANILLDRKVLADLALHDPTTFAAVVDKAKLQASA